MTMSAWNRLLQTTCVLLGLFLGLNSTWAQGRVADYLVTNFSGGYNSISGTGGRWDWTNPWTQAAGLSLPFAFNYDNTTITAGSVIYPTTYGAVALTSTFPPSWTTTVQGNGNYPALLNFLEGTMSTGNREGGTYENYYQVVGSSPNRVLIIELHSVHTVGAGSGNGVGPWSFMTDVQVKLYETTNVIEFLYNQPGRSLGGTWYGYPGVGLNGYKTPTFSTKTVSSTTQSVPSQNIRFTPPPPPAQMSVQPKTLAFGSVVAGSPTTLCTTVSSVGANPLIINGASISGTADYQIISGPAVGTVLQPGATASYCVRFSPLASGSRSAVLSIVSSGKDSGTQQVNLTGIGVAPGISVPVTDYFRKIKITVGDSVTVGVPFQSVGTGPLLINSVQMLAGSTDQYKVKSFPTYPIPVGAWDTVKITFKPTFEGRHDATIAINSNALNSPQVLIRTYGIAIMPRLAISPLNLSFDSVLIGQTLCKNVTLSNPGTDTVNILRVIQTFADNDFTFTPLAPGDTVIRPEESKIYNVCFTPTHVGTRVATVRFYSDIGRTIPDGRDTSQYVLNIMGVGVPYGQLSLEGTVTDSAIIGFENCVTERIVNTGTADFTITSASLSGVDAAEYSFSGLSLPITLKAGQSIPVTYCLTPTVRGVRTASLRLNGLSQDQASTELLPLSGVGLLVCANTDKQTAFDDGMTMVGSVATTAITVTNCGDVTTTYDVDQNWIIGPYMITSIDRMTVPAGETMTINVSYTPTTVGANSAAITVTGNNPGSTPMVIALGGVGGGVVAAGSGGNAGSVKISECADFTVTLTNNGNVDWTPGTPAFAGANASEFTFVSMSPETIPAGGTGTLTLRYCPTVVGNSTASLSFPTSSPEPIGSFTLGLSGIGSQGGGVDQPSALKGFVLGQNHPNPLTHAADFVISVPKETMIRVDLFDQAGAFVRTLVNERMSGERTFNIDATTLASGTYNYVLTSEDVQLVRQMTVVH
jgi:hypothetical protein